MSRDNDRHGHRQKKTVSNNCSRDRHHRNTSSRHRHDSSSRHYRSQPDAKYDDNHGKSKTRRYDPTRSSSKRVESEPSDDMVTDDPVSRRSYFCGLLPREDVEMILEREGEFVVRKIAKAADFNKFNNLCVSVRWKQIVHHVVMRMSAGGLCVLEDDEYETVDQLVESYYKNKSRLTLNSGARLLHPLRNNSWLLRDKMFEPLKILGTGNFGEVWKAKFTRRRGGDSVSVAVKCLKVDKANEEERLSFFSECRKLRQLRHRHVVAFVGMIIDSEPVKLVMEMCNGTLLGRLRDKRWGWVDKARACLHIARAMEYLTACKVIHRDLAARNCLVQDNVVKLADLGMAKTGVTYVMKDTTKPIPVKWTCPHTLQSKVYSELSDVWSFGVLTWEIFTDGQQPYADMQRQHGAEFAGKLMAFLYDGGRLKQPDGTPHDLKRVMLDCMVWTQAARPRFKDIRRRLEATYEELGGEVSFNDGAEQTVRSCQEAFKS